MRRRRWWRRAWRRILRKARGWHARRLIRGRRGRSWQGWWSLRGRFTELSRAAETDPAKAYILPRWGAACCAPTRDGLNQLGRLHWLGWGQSGLSTDWM